MRWCWWCNEKKNKFFFFFIFLCSECVAAAAVVRPIRVWCNCDYDMLFFIYIFFLTRRRLFFPPSRVSSRKCETKTKQHTIFFNRSVADLEPLFRPADYQVSRSLSIFLRFFFFLWFHRHRPTISCDSFCEINIFLSLSCSRWCLQLIRKFFSLFFFLWFGLISSLRVHISYQQAQNVSSPLTRNGRKKTNNTQCKKLSARTVDWWRACGIPGRERFSYRINKQQKSVAFCCLSYDGTVDSRSHNKPITTLLEIIVIDVDRRRVVSSPPFFSQLSDSYALFHCNFHPSRCTQELH